MEGVMARAVAASPAAEAGRVPALLCVANYPANTGYAWDFIEGIYARVADALAPLGMRTLVAYPACAEAPRPLRGSAARAITLKVDFADPQAFVALLMTIRRERVQVLYLSDRPLRHAAYPLLRAAGVRRILVHDHSGGEGERPTGLRLRAKELFAALPGFTADHLIAVSRFVADRQVSVGRIARERITIVPNSTPFALEPDRARARATLGLPPTEPVVMCVARASAGKGVAHLLRGFDLACRALPAEFPPPRLLHLGDGPELPRLQALRDGLASRDRIILAGYRAGAGTLLAAADIVAVPSVEAEAFCLAVLEGMATGSAVIATRVGAIPELIESEGNGLLIPPADADALAAALVRLLTDGALRGRLGREARRRAAAFTPGRQLAGLLPLITEGFDLRCAASPA